MSGHTQSEPAGPYGSYECGCTIGKLGKYVSIDYCSLHRSAPELLTALEALLKEAAQLKHNDALYAAYVDARAAIAKARGE